MIWSLIRLFLSCGKFPSYSVQGDFLKEKLHWWWKDTRCSLTSLHWQGHQQVNPCRRASGKFCMHCVYLVKKKKKKLLWQKALSLNWRLVTSQDFVVKAEKHHLQLSVLVRTPSNKLVVLFHYMDDHIDGLPQLNFRQEYLGNPVPVIQPSQSPGSVSPNANRTVSIPRGWDNLFWQIC